jgi:hypothetical protein
MARERKGLKQLSRYITPPALADERAQLDDAGQVELKLKTQFQCRLTCTQDQAQPLAVRWRL